MIANQMMDYYVWTRHLYSHSRTRTHCGLCRRPSILVVSLICYLLDHAGVHEISALMTWFQCISYIFSHYGDLDPLYIFIMDILFYFILYVAMTTHVTFCISCLFMAIVLLCIWDCYMYLQSCAEFDYYLVLLDGCSSTWFFITPLLGWIYNIFRPSCYPSDITH